MSSVVMFGQEVCSVEVVSEHEQRGCVVDCESCRREQGSRMMCLSV